jgi:hypothetical protein
MPGQFGGVLQDRLMQKAQFGTWDNSQVLIKDPPQSAERVQGLGLPPVAVKRDHQLFPPPLAQRATGHQTLKPGHDLVVAAERKLRIEQILKRRFTQLLQPRRFRRGERTASELLQRQTPPQVQSPPQQPRSSGRVASGQLPAALTDQALRQPCIDHARRSPQTVPRRLSDDAQPCHPGHRMAKAKHIVLQRLPSRPRRIIAPQRIHQRRNADSLPTMHRQHRKQAALHGPAKVNRPITRQLDRAEDPDPPPAPLPVHLSSVTLA